MTSWSNAAKEFDDFFPFLKVVKFDKNMTMCDVEIEIMNKEDNIQNVRTQLKQTKELQDEVHESMKKSGSFYNTKKVVGETAEEDGIEEEEEEEEQSLMFAVRIFDGEMGAKVSKKNLCFIEIIPDTKDISAEKEEEQKNLVKYFMSQGEPNYCEQFKNAITLGPSIDEDGNIDEVTPGEAIFHFFTIGWKVFFALIPPRNLLGGWLAFVIALVFIGLVTAIVGEVAGLFGCACGLKEAVTAITFVALGTSLPDTFASMQAAQQSTNADSAIGNVTGSNSVNVFLGLGLPWVIATIYYKQKDDTSYAVPAGDLAFSVLLFLITSACCIVVLLARRYVSFYIVFNCFRRLAVNLEAHHLSNGYRFSYLLYCGSSTLFSLSSKCIRLDHLKKTNENLYFK